MDIGSSEIAAAFNVTRRQKRLRRSRRRRGAELVPPSRLQSSRRRLKRPAMLTAELVNAMINPDLITTRLLDLHPATIHRDDESEGEDEAARRRAEPSRAVS